VRSIILVDGTGSGSMAETIVVAPGTTSLSAQLLLLNVVDVVVDASDVISGPVDDVISARFRHALQPTSSLSRSVNCTDSTERTL